MDFTTQLSTYKQAIDADIAAYAAHVRKSTRLQYGEYPEVVSSAFLDLLSRGGKRIRGALVMTGYEMCGGQDRSMIVRAATAIEMMHAYMLLIDDIQDRSTLRRGKPTVHFLLADYHEKHGLKGDSAHAGMSLALNAAISGAHAAHMLLAGLEVDPQLRINAIGIIDHTMVVTAHGQTYDIVNQMNDKVSTADIERMMEWKTAHYTFLNPLCVGMVLAGADCQSTDAIRGYALHAGIAFQIADDIKGLYGTKAEIGKDPLDDIREGKYTLLIHHALAHVAAPDKKFFKACLGNPDVSAADLKKIRMLVERCGARAYAQELATQHAAAALEALAKEGERWGSVNVHFLKQLVEKML